VDAADEFHDLEPDLFSTTRHRHAGTALKRGKYKGFAFPVTGPVGDGDAVVLFASLITVNA
jgi:hypothetical protein